MNPFLHTPAKATATARVLMLHGAGAPADSPWMNTVASALASHGLSVYRAEFDYMAQRRVDGKKRPPPKAERLLDELVDLITELPEPELPLWLAGKSMGGRIASMLATASEWPVSLAQPERLLVFGYPFHPAGKPERLRISHLPNLLCPAKILQGSRDPMGNRERVEALTLGQQVDIIWVPEGNHDLRPRGLKQAEVEPTLIANVHQLIGRADFL